MAIEAAPEHVVGCAGGVAFRHHHDVDGRKLLYGTPEGFARQALDPVAFHRRSGNLAGNRKADARLRQLAWRRQQGEESIGGTDAGAENAREFVGFQQPVVARETLTAAERYGQRRARPLARRAFSTLRPPLVAMRARKPWVRLRRRLLGW